MSLTRNKHGEVVEDFVFKTTPYEHQKRGFYLTRDKKYFALLWEMGTGKTKVVIDTAAYLFGKGEIDTLVIIAPNSVHRNWINKEVPIHIPLGNNEYGAIAYHANMNKAEQKRFNKVLTAKNKLRIVAFNVESLSSDKGRTIIEKVLRFTTSMLVLDESHKIKSHTSKRTKTALKLGPLAKYRRILTGTEITQGLEDIFPQYMFLSEDILDTNNFYSFRNKYCVMGGFNRKQIVGYQNEDRLKFLIDRYTIREFKEDCLDLPPKIYTTREVELSPKQRKLYEQVKRDFILEIENGNIISVPLAITRLIRLQQIIGNHIPTEDEDKSVVEIEENNPRLDLLKEICRDLKGKAIIWARFRPEIEDIYKMLSKEFGKDKVGKFYGGTKAKDKEELINNFQEGEVRFFIANAQSGGTGLTLTAANTVIYYSNDFSLENRKQSEDRAHRVGQEKPVVYIDIEAVNTIDTKIVKALAKKQAIADIISGRNIVEFLNEELEQNTLDFSE